MYAYSVAHGHIEWRYKIEGCEHGPVSLALLSSGSENIVYAGTQGIYSSLLIYWFDLFIQKK